MIFIAEETTVVEQKKKRKTVDEYLGITGLVLIAVIGSLFGGIIRPIAYVCGLSAIYYLVKRRKDESLQKNTKLFGWVLVVLWLIIVGVTNSGM